VLLKNWLYKNNNQLIYKAATLLSCCFVVLSVSVNAQINQVSNPSFENISACPTFYNQIKLAIGWDTLKSGGGGGPEAFNSCSNPNTNYGVPINLYSISYQIPKSGASYANLGCYASTTLTIGQRDYIQTQLLNPLIIGNTYCVKFYVSLTNRCKYAIDELGAYFDDGSISSPYYQPALVSPQIKSPTGIFYSDTLNWMAVEGLFTATANHTYLTLGNFKSQATTNYTLAYPSSPAIISEYYFDDVSVIDIATPAYAGRDTLLCNADSVFIGRTPEIGLECQWFNNSIQIAEGAGIWVKPTNTQTYIVKQDLCGIIDYDTVTVTIDPTCTIGIKELLNNQSVTLYPNPANQWVTINSTYKIKKLEMIDVTGKILVVESIDDTFYQLQLTDFVQGIYFIKVSNSDGLSVTKKVFVNQ
jgi:hypothetical protein